MIGENPLAMEKCMTQAATRRFCLRTAIAAGAALLLSSSLARSDDSPDQRLNDALLAEGMLLQQQVSKLQPIAVDLERERKRLTKEEAELNGEAADVTKSFEQYNAAADQLNADIQKQREQCDSGTSKFQSEVETCNQSAEVLTAQKAELSTQGSELDRRQEAVNKRIVQHNAAGREWNNRSTEHQQQWIPSIKQVQDWVGRFNDYVHSESFSKFAAAGGSPVDCANDRIGALNPLEALSSLERALPCLKALKVIR
jgi:DNA repair exonuclease SbcCD ATPase subunit